MDTPRWTLGKMQNPVRGFLHGSAAIAALGGTIFLAWASPNWGVRAGALIFGLTMVALYTTSSLYHSIPWREAWKKRMQRIDHTMILVLIAGTYTPIAIATLDGSLRWAVLAVVWGLVALGAAQHAIFPKENQTFSIALALSMGWLSILIAWNVVQALGWAGGALLLTGGIVYSVGALLLITNRPRLWPRVFSYHEVFHVMVISASALHFVVVWKYVLPLGA